MGYGSLLVSKKKASPQTAWNWLTTGVFSFPRMGGTDVSIRTYRSTAIAFCLRHVESEKNLTPLYDLFDYSLYNFFS